jgi:flagellar basal-body rod protein FlgB
MNNPTIALLKGMLDGCAERQTVLANNVANVNTPGFTRSDTNFREALTQALASHNPEQALAQVHTTVKADRLTQRHENGNNVSLQRELGLSSENKLLYDLAAQSLSAKYARLRSAIRGQ